MGKIVKVELVTPEKIFLREEVGMVIIPGYKGDFAVLPRRAPILVTLRSGVVTFFNKDKKVMHRIFVAGGIADIHNDECKILAENAMKVQDIDCEEIALKLEQAKKDIKETEIHAVRIKIEDNIKYYDSIIKFIEQEERIKAD
ncbi:MAG: ATP synthase F1 subunit epsilon [Alphaproteobacteria bacterium]|nr:ATP synthase F1 subunit epsilon [Alphaproteobacteria bacterium]